VSSSGIVNLLAHTSADGAAATDYAAALAVAAGAVLAVLAVPLVRRGEEAAMRGRRWAHRAAVVVAGCLVVSGLVYPVSKVVGSHEHRKPIGDLQVVFLPGELPRTPGSEAAALGRSGHVRGGWTGEYERRAIGLLDRRLLQPTPNGRRKP
jgi:hypothetical protein